MQLGRLDAKKEKKKKKIPQDERKERKRESTRLAADLTYIEPAEALRQALAIGVERLGLPLAPLPLHKDAWRGRSPQHCLLRSALLSRTELENKQGEKRDNNSQGMPLLD